MFGLPPFQRALFDKKDGVFVVSEGFIRTEKRLGFESGVYAYP